MKPALALLFLALPCLAGEWSLEKLYTRPYIWGTPAQTLTWPEKGDTLVFRWNAGGNRFKDLYAYDPGAEKLTRLTDLESFQDELLASPEETDQRRKMHRPPEPGISSFELSRDGAKVAFAYKGELFLAATDASGNPFRLTRTAAAEASPEFSPGGDRLAFTRGGQVFIQNLATGQLWQVTNLKDQTLAAYDWAPDGGKFVYVARKGKSRRIPLPNYSGRFVTAEPFPRSVAGDDPVPQSVWLIDSDGKHPTEVKIKGWDGLGSLAALEWSKDSGKLLIAIVTPDKKRLRVLVIDAATAASTIVWDQTDDRWVYYPETGWAPDSQSLFVVSDKDGWAHIYTIPAEGGEPTQVTKGSWEARPERISFQSGSGYGPQWVGGYIYYQSTEDGTAERHYYRIRPDGAGKEKLSRHEGVNCGVVSEDGKHIAWQIATIEQPGDLYVDGRRVTNRATAEFSEYPWPETRFISFPSRGDGKTVAAKLLLPPGYDPDTRGGKKWPAVFFIHGAGCATSVLKQWGSYVEERYVFNSYLANQGYVIMDLDYRGSTGYGRDWRSDVYLHMGGHDLDDVLGAAGFMAGLGNIDMERLGIWGVSYGGFMTNMAMFLSPDTFKAGSAWAAVNDWENYNAGYTRQRLNTPAENPEAFRRSSPITFSAGLKNHLLMIHGMGDSNVLFQEAVQLSEKLIQEGKDFSQAYYPQENHGFVRDETWIDACRRTVEWFERYLQ